MYGLSLGTLAEKYIVSGRRDTGPSMPALWEHASVERDQPSERLPTNDKDETDETDGTGQMGRTHSGEDDDSLLIMPELPRLKPGPVLQCMHSYYQVLISPPL
jgi:hypothetical protein